MGCLANQPVDLLNSSKSFTLMDSSFCEDVIRENLTDEAIASWDFNIHEFKVISRDRPLFCIMSKLFDHTALWKAVV
eukprot:TRINITY_DN4053_c0_g1_i1.p3 TRINITY_DN4053_c0_g1~~TRINITY_DN4053_c0_g1_i1.p3  ORF type:complete len:77 (-),score=8.37 TRINITY_DN4053_c0_g1_i1:291-521(-)